MTSEIKLKCKSCKAYNLLNEPSLKTTKNNKFLLSGKCSVCGKSVRSFITNKYNDHLNDDDRTTLKSGGFLVPLPILASLLLQKGINNNPDPIKDGGTIHNWDQYDKDGDTTLLPAGSKLLVKPADDNVPEPEYDESKDYDLVDREDDGTPIIQRRVTDGKGLKLEKDEQRILSLAKSIASKHGLSMFIGNGLLLNEGNGLFLNEGSGLFGNGIKRKRINLFKYKKQHNEIMEKVKLLKSKDKTGGVIDPVSIIIAIISAIVAIITAILSFVQNQQAREREDAERVRREQETKKSEDDQKLYELKEMLKSYNDTLGELAAEANLPVKDFILQQLKDSTSKVSSMKRTILSKAKDFNKTPPDFVDYCMEIAGQYEWYNVNALLQIMKEELVNPGFIIREGGTNLRSEFAEP